MREGGRGGWEGEREKGSGRDGGREGSGMDEGKLQIFSTAGAGGKEVIESSNNSNCEVGGRGKGRRREGGRGWR